MFVLSPGYHLSRLRLILVVPARNCHVFTSRDRYTHWNPRRLGPTSTYDPHVSYAIAELVRTLLPLVQLVASSLFRRTPYVRLRLGGLRHAGLARPVPRWTFSGVETPDVPSKPSERIFPQQLVEAAAHIICAPFLARSRRPDRIT